MRLNVAMTIGVALVTASMHAYANAIKIEITSTQNSSGKLEYGVVGAPAEEFEPGDTLEIKCPGSCNALVVATNSGDKLKENTSASGVATPNPWKSEALMPADQIIISFEDMNWPLKKKGSSAPGSPAPGDGNAVSSLVQPACPGQIMKNEIAVDTTGNVLASRLEDFSEDDALTVWTLGPEAVLTGVKVIRRSAFRDVTVLRIQGDTSKVVGTGKQSGGKLSCKRVVLTGFSAGRGQFAILGPNDNTMAEFEFAVYPVYDGMFTVAFVGTWLPNHKFSLRDRSGESVIVEDPTGKAEGRYALMYTAFLPLQTWMPNRIRDRAWNQRIGVTAGVLLDDPANNILFGVNFGPVHGLSLVAGGHAGKVTRLDGVKVGDVLAVNAVIPTRNQWDVNWFVGMSLDISVGTRLFFSMFKAAP